MISMSYWGIASWWGKPTVPPIQKLVDLTAVFDCRLEDIVVYYDTLEASKDPVPEAEEEVKNSITALGHFLVVNAKTDGPALDAAKAALQKQIALPLEPTNIVVYKCPVCGETVHSFDCYCSRCGQKIKL